MAQIIPAILENSLGEIHAKLKLVLDAAPLVQLDVCDSSFAHQKTWPLFAAGPKELERILSGDEGLPFWEDFDFQFDLMQDEPLALAEKLILAGASSIVLHAKAKGALDAARTLQSSRGPDPADPFDARGGEFPIALGIAIMPDASLETLAPFSSLYDFVQVMGIARVGSQGQAFDPQAIEIVRQLRSAQPGLIIQVDGGVTFDNAPELLEAGATRLVVGSAIFNDEDPKAALVELQEIAG